MFNPRKLIGTEWMAQMAAVIRRKRITYRKNLGTEAANKGHFVADSAGGRRFEIPLSHINNSIFIKLFEMSEEEFGLPGGGPITFPCDAFFMECIVSLVEGGINERLEKALLMSVATPSGSLLSSSHGLRNQQILVCD